MIAFAEQRGNGVFVYGVNGNLLWTKDGNLLSYTSTTVVIKRGTTTFVYGERGELKFTR